MGFFCCLFLTMQNIFFTACIFSDASSLSASQYLVALSFLSCALPRSHSHGNKHGPSSRGSRCLPSLLLMHIWITGSWLRTEIWQRVELLIYKACRLSGKSLLHVSNSWKVLPPTPTAYLTSSNSTAQLQNENVIPTEWEIYVRHLPLSSKWEFT